MARQVLHTGMMSRPNGCYRVIRPTWIIGVPLNAFEWPLKSN